MSSRLLFFYGTLVDPQMLARQLGDRRIARRALLPARLEDHRRAPVRGTPYLTVVRDPGSVVEGRLFRATPTALARLTAYEGPLYRLAPVHVRTSRGRCRAYAWTAPRWLVAR